MRYLLLLLILTSCSSAQVVFCNPELCNTYIADNIASSEKADCAFYSISSEKVEQALENHKGKIRIVMHNRKNGLMHNKFCILDEIVITGSYNPRDKAGRHDHILIIKDDQAKQNFQSEFNELWTGVFGKGLKTEEQGQIKTYFCPEDDCALHVIEEISKAKEQICFLEFSFTSGEIAVALIERYQNGIKIKGVMDNSQIRQYSMFSLLNNQGIIVRKGNLHDKLFIIDNTVISGSFNPTKNAQLRNDENIVIIKNKLLSEQLREECNRIFKQSFTEE